MNKGLKVLLISDSLITLALAMVGPIYAIFVQQIGGDLLDASWAFFAFLLTSGIVVFLLGQWEDHIKHKEKFITLGYAFTALGCLSYVFVNSQLTLVLTQVILGLAEAVQLPAYDAMFTAYVDKKHSASEWSLWESLYYFMTAFGALIGGYVAKLFGFRHLFFAMFIISSIGVVYSLFLFGNGLKQKKKPSRKS